MFPCRSILTFGRHSAATISKKSHLLTTAVDYAASISMSTTKCFPLKSELSLKHVSISGILPICLHYGMMRRRKSFLSPISSY